MNKLTRKVRKKDVERIYEVFIKKQGADFERLLQYHMSLRNITNVKKTFTENPMKFKAAFIGIFGSVAWSIFLSVLKEACKTAGIKEEYVEKLFETEDETIEKKNIMESI